MLERKRLLITDTSMRDAHQSLIATRMRTRDMLRIADSYTRGLPGLFSLEMWGGATFDTAMRFLKECPWERLAQLREHIPGTLFQMLFRGSNAVGYSNYPDKVVAGFVKHSADSGMDIFRIFDSLNYLPNMRVAMEAAREHGKVLCEAALCYTGDILDENRTKFSLDYYIKKAKELESMGAHILAIKDMAGLCKPQAAYNLVHALKQEIGIPIHFHTHDTSGLNAASVIAAARAGVDIVDLALASMSGSTSQPNLNSVCAALANSDLDPRLDFDTLNEISDYWEETLDQYEPFNSAPRAGTAEVYEHEMPGGQYTNLREQANAMGLGHRWREIARTYAEVNQLFGDIVKVTPSSKVVGDMAMFLITPRHQARRRHQAQTRIHRLAGKRDRHACRRPRATGRRMARRSPEGHSQQQTRNHPPARRTRGLGQPPPDEDKPVRHAEQGADRRRPLLTPDVPPGLRRLPEDPGTVRRP